MPLGKFILMAISVCFIGILLASGTIDLASIIGISLVLIGFDVRNPILLKNLFLVYTFVLFAVAGQYFNPGETDLIWDMNVYLIAFLAGYSLLMRNRRPVTDSSYKQPAFLNVVTIERMMILYCATRLFMLIYEVYMYGFGNFYSGASLIEDFESYGRADFSLGLLTMANQFMIILNVALLVLYVSACSLGGRRIRYPIVVFMTVVLPILLLQRSNLALGCIVLLVITLWDRRTEFSPVVYARIAVVMIFIIALGVGIGLLRDNAFNVASEGASTASADITRVLSGEFTPIVAYQGIKINIDYLGYQYGNTIFPTMLFKLTPRSWMPDKPTSSSGYFMEKILPNDAAGGYFISSSIYGDMYLNFGFLGVILFCLLLGGFSARIDLIFIEHNVRLLPMFLIIYYYYYVLLRGDLQGSLSLVLLTAAVYFILKKLIGYISVIASKPDGHIVKTVIDSPCLVSPKVSHSD